MIKISNVNIKKMDKEDSRMKGVASILIDDCFAVRDIRIIQGDDRLFVAMPSRKDADGMYKDIVHPINKEARALVEDAILEEYNKTEIANEEE